MDERLTELEIKFMEQADSLESLSNTVYQQQQTIQFLRLELQNVTNRLQSLSTSVMRPESEETPPPHY